jgi:hypothetical protein
VRAGKLERIGQQILKYAFDQTGSQSTAGYDLPESRAVSQVVAIGTVLAIRHYA